MKVTQDKNSIIILPRPFTLPLMHPVEYHSIFIDSSLTGSHTRWENVIPNETYHIFWPRFESKPKPLRQYLKALHQQAGSR